MGTSKLSRKREDIKSLYAIIRQKMLVWYKTGHLKRRSLPLPFCALLSSNCSPMYLAVSGGVSSYSSSSTGIGLATPIRTLPERERIVSTGAITKHNANTAEACSVP